MRTKPTLILMITLATLVGCAGTYDRLPSQQDDALLSSLFEETVIHKNESHRIETTFDDKKHGLAVHEYGSRDAERCIVLIHGCASDSDGWRFVVGHLARNYLVLVIDLLGCGASDKPRPDDVGSDGYSPTAMAMRVSQALARYESENELPGDVTLVGHSLGGAITLRMLGCERIRENCAVLDRVDRTVLLSPLDIEMPNLPAELRALAEVSSLAVQLGQLSGVLRDRLANGVLGSVCNPSRALKEEVDKFHELLTEKDRLLATQAILVQALPLIGEKLDWSRSEKMVEDYGNVDMPCLILWGERDETLPIAMGHKLAAQLPNAELHPVPNCKHSIQLEFPILCAESVREFSENDMSETIEFDLEHVASNINSRRIDRGLAGATARR